MKKYQNTGNNQNKANSGLVCTFYGFADSSRLVTMNQLWGHSHFATRNFGPLTRKVGLP